MLIPKKVTDRIVSTVAQFQKVLQNAKDRDVNESDTVLIISDILAQVFGFDKYSEVTSEFAIRGTYCDLAIKLDSKVEYLLEAKAIGIDLKESHLRQAVDYGANHGIAYIVLSNGVWWQIHKIRFEQPISSQKICEFNFLELNPRKTDDQEKLFLLSKEGLQRKAITEYHDHVEVVNRFMISAVLQGDPVVDLVRKELRKVSDGLRIDPEEIRVVIQSEVLKRDVIEGEEAIQAMSKIRRAMARAQRKQQKPEEQSNTSSDELSSLSNAPLPDQSAIATDNQPEAASIA